VYLGRVFGAAGFERIVAIKDLHPHLVRDRHAVSMLLDEARVAARIGHPNVVSILDVDEDEDGVFLVMEYVDGPSLRALTRALHAAGTAIPLGVALRILLDALAGLHAAHELVSPEGTPLGIVHLDVSPQNILIGADGMTRITDFGVARTAARLSDDTAARDLEGTLGYMSTEQLRSQPVDRRSDVYAAGVVLWELLTGERLFPGDNEWAIALAASSGPKRTPRAANDTVPVAIDRACMRALSLVPDDRYPTAAGFAAALEAAAADDGIAIAEPRDVATLIGTLQETAPRSARGTRRWSARKASEAEPPSSNREPSPAAETAPTPAPAAPPTSAPPPTSMSLSAPDMVRGASLPRPQRARAAVLGAAVLAVCVGAWLWLGPLGADAPSPIERGSSADSASAAASSAPPTVEPAVDAGPDTPPPAPSARPPGLAPSATPPRRGPAPFHPRTI